MPTPWSTTRDVDVVADRLRGELHRAAVVGELHGVLEQVVDGRDELAAVPEDRHGVGRLLELDLHLAVIGRGPYPLECLGHDERDEHRLARRCLLGLYPGEVEEVVDDPAHPEGLCVDP